MANGTIAAWIQANKMDMCSVTAATTGFATDAPANVVLLSTGGTNPAGSIITKLWAIPRAGQSATSLLLFLYDQTSGLYKLMDSEAMPTYSPSTTSAIPEVIFTNYTVDDPLRLGPNQQLYVGMQVAGNVDFFAKRGDY